MVQGKKKTNPRRSARASKSNIVVGNQPVVGGKKYTQPVKTTGKNTHSAQKKAVAKGSKGKKKVDKVFSIDEIDNQIADLQNQS